MRSLAALLLALGFGHAAPPAAAAEQAPAQAANPHINCTCRANGRSYALGERVCLSTPSGGRRLAECRMQENVTSWRLGPEDCAETARMVPPATPVRNPAAS